MIRTTLWVVLFAVVIDFTLNSIFTVPYRYERGAQLANYFEYGRSVESKIMRMVGENDDEASLSAKAGWFRNKLEIRSKFDPAQGRTDVYVYGMSFSNHIGELLSDIDASLNVHFFDGPGAPLNHSFAYYEHTRPHNPGDIVILGVLASSLPRLHTLSHMTANFESPSPHFYPRYRLEAGNRLGKIDVGIDSLPELRAVINDDAAWKDVKSTLAASDAFYDPIIFEKTVLDSSVYIRLVKRAWGQRSLGLNVNRYHDASGFKNTDRSIDLAQTLVAEFAARARSDGAAPYLIVFNDRGYDDHLYRALEPVLVDNGIAYYSTHRRFPATNLANFVPDGHFRPDIDREIAEDVYHHLLQIDALGTSRIVSSRTGQVPAQVSLRVVSANR